MHTYRRLPWAAALVIVFGAGLTGVGLLGCQEEGGDTRNIVEVVSLNQNQPLMSDVYDLGDKAEDPADDFIPVDVVEVTFKSRVHDSALSIQPDEPFGSVKFTSYDLVFEDANHSDGVDLDGNGTVDLKNRSHQPMNAVVPIGGTGSAGIVIVSGGDKIVPPISCLGPLGGDCGSVDAAEFSVNASITFHGIEETSGDDVTVKRGLTVRIGQFADK